MENSYDKRYNKKEYYWGIKPSPLCLRVIEIQSFDKLPSLLDIGCGEGRHTVFFARNGYLVDAFDTSLKGIEKAQRLAKLANVEVNIFKEDINNYILTKPYDVLFSTGVLQYIPQESRKRIFENYQNFTNPDGLNVFSVLIKKPFIPESPDHEETEYDWVSGEILTYYKDWKIEYFLEDIFDDISSGIPHQHAVNRIIARKISI